jgi:catechol 2,3-dioxygenase-like lactoylglutathione lyase family enzyme
MPMGRPRVGAVATAPYTVLGWNVADIHAAIAAPEERGVAFARFDGVEQDPAGVWTAPGGTLVAWFHDPDGNRLSLSQTATATPLKSTTNGPSRWGGPLL